MGRCFPASALVLLCLASAILVAFAQNYLPTDKILLDCGATSDDTDSDGQKWTADKGSKFLVSTGNSSTSPAATQDPAVPQVPFMTARVFHSDFTYSFPLAAGRKFVRLWAYTLLKNFSVAQTTEALNFAFIVKEYSINVDGGTLNITFSPSSNSSKYYAFVNGIEIVSMPDIYSNTDGTLMIVGNSAPFTIDNSTALENVYRLNVGGNDISPSGDTADVVAWANDHNGVPVHKDYVVLVPGGSPQQDLWLALRPNTDSVLKSQFYDAILNGVEIFKISTPGDGNLAGPNPIPAPKQEVIDPSLVRPSSGSGHSKNQKAIIAGGVSGGVVIALVIGCCVIAASRHRRQGKEASASDGPSGKLCFLFTFKPLPPLLFAEIKAATNNFDEALLLGVGGFGKVYKGEIDGGTTKVAIKRGNPLSEQGVHEFQTEIEMLSKLRHRHLVSLIGYCEENCEMILVYDYMAHGTLPLNPTLPKEQVSLAEWAAHCLNKGILVQIVDPYLKGKIAPECFRKFAETAMKCVADQGIERPSMGDVLWNLEFALQLQESAEESGKGIGGIDDKEMPFNMSSKGKKDPDASVGFDGNITDSRSSGMSMSIGGRSLASEDSDGLTPSAVFSQIMNPKGR
ncbi:hypothetical protein GH714_019825 [Hevea brasiliensis]|uniref:Protein kinase domain-containing protein n=1 Tax=Hevea brasiliensis TaxID=3981 RepID=A0A6A6M1W7_HEVBR|nr:hypothetical protein GH714_019825 [Hevea brasiliensis]